MAVQQTPRSLVSCEILSNQVCVMAFKESPFGFWIPVTDKESAEYAAKMSGLPIFLLGLNFCALALVQVFVPQPALIYAAYFCFFIFGLFLIFSGLRIRKQKFGTLPVSLGLWLFLNLVGVLIIGVGIGTIITLLIGLLAVSGLRGWLWLRRNSGQ